MPKNLSTTYKPRHLTPRREGEPSIDLTVGWIEHRALRADMSRLLEVLGDDRADRLTVRRAEAVAKYVNLIVFNTHRHHRIEDNGMWPLLAASSLGEIDLAPFTADHEKLDRLLDALAASADAFAHAPVQERPKLYDSLRAVAELLEDHLGREEQVVFPALERYVSVEDFDRLEKLARREFSPADLTFMGPWMARYASVAERNRALTPSWPYRVILAIGGPSYRRLEGRAFS
jgi:hemerythrin-like domain-containing protein